MNETLFIALVASIPGMIVGLTTLWIAKHKTPVETKKLDAELDDTNVRVAMSLVEPMRKRIAELEEHQNHQDAVISELRMKIAKLEADLTSREKLLEKMTSGAHALYYQVISADLPPVYVPSEYLTVRK